MRTEIFNIILIYRCVFNYFSFIAYNSVLAYHYIRNVFFNTYYGFLFKSMRIKDVGFLFYIHLIIAIYLQSYLSGYWFNANINHSIRLCRFFKIYFNEVCFYLTLTMKWIKRNSKSVCSSARFVSYFLLWYCFIVRKIIVLVFKRQFVSSGSNRPDIYIYFPLRVFHITKI